MKKIYFGLLIIFCLLLVCSCGNALDTDTGLGTDTSSDTDSTVDEKITLKVEYLATEGGYINGKTQQSCEVIIGEEISFDRVRAVASEGYYFVEWSDGFKNNIRSDTISENESFTAIFEKYIVIKYQASEGGRLYGESEQQLKANESSSEVTAAAYDGYRFVGWSDGTTSATRTDFATKDYECSAIFEKIQYYNVSYKSENGGRIEGKATQSVENGKESEPVKAVPSKGYYFVKWSDGVLTAERSDSITEDVTLTAIFSNQITIRYEASEGGYISGESEQVVVYGSSSSIVSVVAEPGYMFVGWDDGRTGTSRNDVAKENITYKANFKIACEIDFICDAQRGEISGVASQVVPYGDKAKTVTAIPNEGFVFVCWSDGSTNPEISVTALTDVQLYAHFSYESTGLPVVSIVTETGWDVVSKTEYIGCTVSLYDTEKYEHFVEQEAKIRGRGNSTWDNFPKKPYKIKFESKQDFFDNGKAKTWVLLADYRDYSLIRNYLAYEIGEELSELKATPDCQSVEVYLNGEYRGVYLLCEQIEVNDHRVEISEDTTSAETGFLVEMDGWTDEVQVYVPDNLKNERKYSVKFPDSDEITYQQKKFIEDYLKACISAIQGDDYSKVTELIDVKSFAQAYIVLEMFKNPDTDYSSLYFYKDAGGKLICGPLWDFDMSVGNVSHKGEGVFESTETLWSKEKCPWFKGLLGHEEFVSLVGEELTECAPIIRATLERKIEYVYAHADAYKKNFEKWNIIGTPTWSNPDYLVEITTWEEHIEYVRSYLESSLAYLEQVYCGMPQQA